ncbi:MAG: 5-(carboxyamino)imidazole ribonucleotide synthase [Caulobacterales bacterium]|uniref:5-(carboxyamino)imidazole ribonucleotide synthase n=1 Tax=Glycocaulis sp. TaxID=1969725 RepID=UPI003F9FE14C
MLKPGARIGILGGGQLGRMLALDAARLGFDCVIFTPEDDSPAGRVAAACEIAPYEDLEAVARFAASVDVVTYEFENVPVETAQAAGRHAPLRPGVKALEVCQDRVTEKSFVNEAGIETTPWQAVSSAKDAIAAAQALGVPAILKTRRLGYDGKGQQVVRRAGDAASAFEALGSVPCILEAFAPFTREVSVVAARSVDGAVAAFPLAENHHEGGILRVSTAPAPGADGLAGEALRIASAILSGLEYVGVLAVELFVLEDGRLWVNEIAPRVHNTGHWTMDACTVSQFEQHIRAIAGWPLGDPAPHSAARMDNLIGADVERWQALASEPGVCLHLYGKGEAREGRKMGHVNRLSPLS